MSKLTLVIIIIAVSLNAAFLFFYLSKPTETQSNANITSNQSSQKPIPSNQTVNISSIYMSNCVNSTKNQAEKIENITEITEIESRFFDKGSNVTSYLQHNWSNVFYSINGTQKDIVNKTVVSIFEIISNRGRNFTIPILCNVNGSIGNYSSCLLNNIPNIPSACYNLSINISDCENEWSNHFILDDIQYWITPGAGSIIISSVGSNITSQTFNFTISSSRQRLESFGMEITKRTFNPLSDKIIFSSTKNTPNGKGGSIVYKVNLTGTAGVEFYSTAWFKKKCYDKYVIY